VTIRAKASKSKSPIGGLTHGAGEPGKVGYLKGGYGINAPKKPKSIGKAPKKM
jgi:hypothetical protein